MLRLSQNGHLIDRDDLGDGEIYVGPRLQINADQADAVISSRFDVLNAVDRACHGTL